MSKKETCSSHSWVALFCQRRLTAMPKLSTAWPPLVKRSSGSLVTLPVNETKLSLAMLMFPSVWVVVGSVYVDG